MHAPTPTSFQKQKNKVKKGRELKTTIFEVENETMEAKKNRFVWRLFQEIHNMYCI